MPLIHKVRCTARVVSPAIGLTFLLAVAACSGTRTGPAYDESFVDLVGREVLINTGLRAVEYSPKIQIGGGLERTGEAAILLLNETNEWIEFDNVGYGQRVFQRAAETDDWREIRVQVRPVSQSLALAPGLNEYEIEANNIWLFQLDDLAEELSGQVRVFFVGRGRESGTVYGASVDYALEKANWADRGGDQP